jgi:hypothetical protein
LCIEVLSALAEHVVIYLLPGVEVPDVGSACDRELWSALLEAGNVCDVIAREKADDKVSIVSPDLLLEG